MMTVIVLVVCGIMAYNIVRHLLAGDLKHAVIDTVAIFGMIFMIRGLM